MTDLRDKVASKALDVAGDKPTIYDLVRRQESQIAVALPRGMDAARFTRLVITQVRQTPKLAECTPESLLGALMISAQVGLEVGPLGHAWLIPRYNSQRRVNEVTWQLGYKGIIELARRSGQLSLIDTHEVCENDEFDFAYGLDPHLVHKPTIRGERGPAYAYYAIAKFKDGGNAFIVMSKADIDRRRARSASSGKGPWDTDYDAMARKTTIRALQPVLPLATEQVRVMEADGRVFDRVEPNMIEEAEAAGELGPPTDPNVMDADVVGEDGAGREREGS